MKTIRPFILTLLALALAACGKSGPATPASTEPKKLSLFCWSEYVPQTIIDDFTKETGIKVAVENFERDKEKGE